MIQAAIDGTIFFEAGWQKPVKSVEKSVHGYGLRPICTLYQNFCQKIVVLLIIFVLNLYLPTYVCKYALT